MPKGSFFHHPDISMPVLRRRSTQAFLEMLELYGMAVATKGRSLTWNASFPSQSAYRTAVSRLKKTGVVAYRDTKDGSPVLHVTKKAPARDRALFHPDRYWKEKWSGFWSVLIYDIPESQRSFRDGLRRFLVSQRMGCLQKSVWVGPRDIRPAYDDLVQSVGVDFVSYLFEARTVLGRGPQELVRAAWDLKQLNEVHLWYLAECRRGREWLEKEASRAEDVERLAGEELAAYLTALQNDPLLPRSLLPPDYRGPDVFAAHTDFVKHARTLLRQLP